MEVVDWTCDSKLIHLERKECPLVKDVLSCTNY